MKYNQYKCFNIEASRPQVLLTGNGLTRNNKPWAELIQSLARDGVPVTEFTSKTGEISLPYTIMTLAMADTEDVVRKKKYQDLLRNCSPLLPPVKSPSTQTTSGGSTDFFRS